MLVTGAQQIKPDLDSGTVLFTEAGTKYTVATIATYIKELAKKAQDAADSAKRTAEGLSSAIDAASKLADGTNPITINQSSRLYRVPPDIDHPADGPDGLRWATVAEVGAFILNLDARLTAHGI
jgi:hypothetical protein